MKKQYNILISERKSVPRSKRLRGTDSPLRLLLSLCQAMLEGLELEMDQIQV